MINDKLLIRRYDLILMIVVMIFVMDIRGDRYRVLFKCSSVKEEARDKIKDCKEGEVELFFKDLSKQYYYSSLEISFEQMYEYINCKVCKIGREEFKEILLREYEKMEIDTIEGEEDEYYSWILRMMSTEEFGDRYEELKKKKKDEAKRKGLMDIYYRIMSYLVRNSVRWDEYLREVIELRDSVREHYGDRERVYRSVVNRFSNEEEFNKLGEEEKRKLERMLYKIVVNKWKWFEDKDDKLLVKLSDVYRDSKERKKIIEEWSEIYYKAYNKPYKYCEDVKKYLSSLKELKDYRPPGE